MRIPIHVSPSAGPPQASSTDVPPVAETVPPMADQEMAERNTQHVTRDTQGSEEETLDVWRDRALRLQAEIENFRKRQQRLAEERIAADRERLLRSFLYVADDLERALNVDTTHVGSVRQGVDLTYQKIIQLLNQEGVEPIQSVGQPFDPTWHEAVDTVPHQQAGVEPDTIVKVTQKGYRLGDRLLRPARVIVAV